MNICLYHGIDLDGFCSGAIYHKHNGDLPHKMIPMNYGWEIPWAELAGANVCMVDFSFKSADMKKLLEIAAHVTVIDHHKTAIEELSGFRGHPGFLLYTDVTKAGCELAWEYFHPTLPMPEAVRLLGRYDVWDHSDPSVLPFQYGCRVLDLRPVVGDKLWDAFIDNRYSNLLVSHTIQDGRLILRYQKQEDKVGAKSCFEVEWLGSTWIVANRSGRGSMFFDSVKTSKHKGMITYQWNGEQYVVSLYSDGAIDCGAVAKELGGGGHVSAAGFRCENLPFCHHGKRI